MTNNQTELKTNAAGAIGVLARGHADNQAALIRCGAIPLLCSAIKEGFLLGAAGAFLEMIEESAGALWALAADSSAVNKQAVAAGGAVTLLMNLLNNCQTKRSADVAANGLAALGDKCPENLTSIVEAQVRATTPWSI